MTLIIGHTYPHILTLAKWQALQLFSFHNQLNYCSCSLLSWAKAKLLSCKRSSYHHQPRDPCRVYRPQHASHTINSQPFLAQTSLQRILSFLSIAILYHTSLPVLLQSRFSVLSRKHISLMSQPIIDKIIYKKELLWAARNIVWRYRANIKRSMDINNHISLLYVEWKCSKLQFYDPAINYAKVLGENFGIKINRLGASASGEMSAAAEL